MKLLFLKKEIKIKSELLPINGIIIITPLIGKNSDFILIIFFKKNTSLIPPYPEQQFYFNHAAEGQHE